MSVEQAFRKGLAGWGWLGVSHVDQSDSGWGNVGLVQLGTDRASLSLFICTWSSASLPHCTVASGQLNEWRPQGCASQLQEWGFQPRSQILRHLLWLNLGRLEELHLLHGVGYKWGTNLPRCKRSGIKLHLLVREQQGSRKHTRWETWLWSSLRNAICCLCFIGRILGPRVYRNAVKWFFVCLGIELLGLWDLISPVKDRTRNPAAESQSSNLQTAREVPCCKALTCRSRCVRQKVTSDGTLVHLYLAS